LLAQKLNIKDNVSFVGFVTTEELIHLYSSAEAYVFPTPQEDFGLCPAEALSCGTPVITWGDGSGPAEQVIDTVNGYHVKPYDIEDMGKKIDICIECNLKKNNQQQILNSIKIFSEEGQKHIFIKEINSIINKNQKV